MNSCKLNKMIGNFQIGKVIGSGAFGKVREAVHLPTNQKVALKILQKNKIKNKKDLQRIQKELEILKSLNHPNILKLLEVKQSEKQIFIITELAKGQELYDKIVRKTNLTLDQACKYFVQLYQAVKYLQSQKVAHRDVKPQNIIVDGQNLKLIDFGLSAQWNQSKTMMDTPCGSPCYAAPQMVLGKKYDCRNVDIWAMGITLYAMLVGKLPFQHQNTQKLYKVIQHSEYQQIKGVPSCVSILLRAMIEKDPKKRIKIDQIGDNIWIKDKLAQISLNNKSKKVWNKNILAQMKIFYNVSQENLITQMTGNPISQFSTYYYLRAKKQESERKAFEYQVHEGAFHIQFAYRSIEGLQMSLERNHLSFEWVKSNGQTFKRECSKDDQKGTLQKVGKKWININGQILVIKRIKNLPKLLYLPLKRQWMKTEKETEGNINQLRARAGSNLNSSCSTVNDLCIETF